LRESVENLRRYQQFVSTVASPIDCP